MSHTCKKPCLISRSDSCKLPAPLLPADAAFLSRRTSATDAVTASVTITSWLRVSSKGSSRRTTFGCLSFARLAASLRHSCRKASAVFALPLLASVTERLSSIQTLASGLEVPAATIARIQQGVHMEVCPHGWFDMCQAEKCLPSEQLILQAVMCCLLPSFRLRAAKIFHMHPGPALPVRPCTVYSRKHLAPTPWDERSLAATAACEDSSFAVCAACPKYDLTVCMLRFILPWGSH